MPRWALEYLRGHGARARMLCGLFGQRRHEAVRASARLQEGRLLTDEPRRSSAFEPDGRSRAAPSARSPSWSSAAPRRATTSRRKGSLAPGARAVPFPRPSSAAPSWTVSRPSSSRSSPTGAPAAFRRRAPDRAAFTGSAPALARGRRRPSCSTSAARAECGTSETGRSADRSEAHNPLPGATISGGKGSLHYRSR